MTKEIGLCNRCGSKVDVEDAFPRTSPKCLACQGFRFDRQFFDGILSQVKKNFVKAKTTHFGTILKSLYVFGSYNTSQRCGDLDVLFTYSKPKLDRLIKLEKNKLWNLESDIWGFNQCQEYPDCLSCHELRGCHLPQKDYASDVHWFCLNECRSPKRIVEPDCSFGDCFWLSRELELAIFKVVGNMLKRSIDFVYRVKPNLKLKILDLCSGINLKAFLKSHKDFNNFNPMKVC